MSTERVAIVTGGATGIGRAVALDLAAEGYRVVVNYFRSAEEARRTADAIQAAGSPSLIAQGDVSSDADCRRIVDEVQRAWGRIDVLVNNAGYSRAARLGDLEEVAEDDWDRTFAVNVKGAFFMTRACAASLRKSRGAVVNVSSTAGVSSVGSSIPYAASKAALNNLTVALARALAPEVRVNAVLPGYVETAWNERIYGARLDAMRKLVKQQTLLGDVASPEKVAQVVRSLAVGMRWVTGEHVIVDGGLLVHG